MRELRERLRMARAPWELRDEALQLEELFDRLEGDEAPTPERMAAITRLLSLHRRALEYLIKT